MRQHCCRLLDLILSRLERPQAIDRSDAVVETPQLELNDQTVSIGQFSKSGSYCRCVWLARGAR